jgi:hypothetical protein
MLTLSMKAFCCGSPGAMQCQSTRDFGYPHFTKYLIVMSDLNLNSSIQPSMSCWARNEYLAKRGEVGSVQMPAQRR